MRWLINVTKISTSLRAYMSKANQSFLPLLFNVFMVLCRGGKQSVKEKAINSNGQETIAIYFFTMVK